MMREKIVMKEQIKWNKIKSRRLRRKKKSWYKFISLKNGNQ